jgi:hypothetical protein
MAMTFVGFTAIIMVLRQSLGGARSRFDTPAQSLSRKVATRTYAVTQANVLLSIIELKTAA